MRTKTIYLKFNKKLYSSDTLKKAAYKFSNRFSHIISENKDEYVCNIQFPEKASESQINFSIDEFKKEVSDQDLRNIVSKETEQVRNLILAHAFSKTNLIKDD